MRKTKILSGLLCVLMGLLMASCTGSKGAIDSEKISPVNQEGRDSRQMRIFTDSVGRQVEIPSDVQRVVVSGPLAQVVVYSFAPEKMVGRAIERTDTEKKYIPEEYMDMPLLGQLYGKGAELNKEVLIAQNPDVAIDVGEAKKSIKADMDSLQEQTNIPFVHIDSKLSDMGYTYRKLGELFDQEEKGEEYAKYLEKKYKSALDIMAKVGDKKKKVLYVLGPKGLNVVAKSSFHAEPIDIMTDNVAVVEKVTPKGTGNEVDMEQIISWNPEYIIFAPDSIADKVTQMPGWDRLDAIKTGNYCVVPKGPYNWLMDPPSIQRVLGMMWLGNLLYPEYIDYDLKEEVKEYFEMFFHYDLTDEEYYAMVDDKR